MSVAAQKEITSLTYGTWVEVDRKPWNCVHPNDPDDGCPDVTAEQVEAGHAFYTRRALAVYDLAILGYFSRVAWRCSAKLIVEHYDRHVSANHLDVGVGTGYFLDHCRFPSPAPRVALMDMNVHDKAVVFANLKAITNPGGKIFGATLLHDGVHRNWMARKVMDRNNRHGIFSNECDDLSGMQSVLAEHLVDPQLTVVGCVGLFSGTA